MSEHLLRAWARLIEAAEDEDVYYHGTTRARLKHITPATKHGKGVIFPSDTDPAHAYATKSHDDAWDYAEKAWHATGTGIPRVYKVRAKGPVEKDPIYNAEGGMRGNHEDDVRSKHGFDVIHEMPMPEHMGDPEDWK